MTPDRKVDERSAGESVSKKIKFDERVSDEKLSNKKTKTTISTDFTPTPSTSFASETVIEISDDDEKFPIFIVDEEAEFQTISNVNSGAPICNVLEERRKKFMQVFFFHMFKIKKKNCLSI